MTKADLNNGAGPSKETLPRSSKQLSATLIAKRNSTKRPSRKVKFAEPVAERRLYDRTASPNTETELIPDKNPKSLNDLQPPLSLVAQLDLAAKKLNARDGSKVPEEALTDLKGVRSSKSVKSFKSTRTIKSILTPKSSSPKGST